MVSDFNILGFHLQKSSMKLSGRLSKMVLLVALAMRVCMAAATDARKKRSGHGCLAKRNWSRLSMFQSGLRWLGSSFACGCKNLGFLREYILRTGG